MTLQDRLHQIFELVNPDDRVARGVQTGVVVLILLNAIALVLETVPEVQTRYAYLFQAFEAVSTAFFTAEYLLRVYAASAAEGRRHPVFGRLRYMLTPFALIDLVAILPSLLHLGGLDFRFVRTIRMFRLFRLAKLGRYAPAFRLLGRAFGAKREELVITLTVLSFLLLMSSTVMYYAEHEAQPVAFGSIPKAAWWAIITLTTVGYGDVYPITPLGKLLAAIIAIFGIGMVALPTGVLGAAFVDEVQRSKGPGKHCPHCGKEL